MHDINLKERIAIVGPSGSGKSTIARKLAQITKLPLFHLDRYYWKPGWKLRNEAEWAEIQQQLIQENPCWIIEGTYSNSLPIRFEPSQTIIYLDYPKPVYIWRAFVRAISNYGKSRSDVANGCQDNLNWKYVLHILTWSKTHDPAVKAMVKKYSAGRNVYVLRNDREVQDFLQKVAEPFQQTTD